MIYFDIEIKEYDFDGVEYVKHTHLGSSFITKNILGPIGVMPSYGFLDNYLHPRHPIRLKYIICGKFHTYEPYSK